MSRHQFANVHDTSRLDTKNKVYTIEVYLKAAFIHVMSFTHSDTPSRLNIRGTEHACI